MAARPSQVIAEFMADLRWIDLPTRIQDRAVDFFIDTVASALAGRGSMDTAEIERAAIGFGGVNDSVVIGGGRLPMAAATLVNGYQVTAGMLCDIHRPTLCHVTPEVVPPVFAVAQQKKSTGRDLLLSIVAGLETTVRVGMGMNYQAMRAKGWHSPGVIGPFGGATAVGKILGLGPIEMQNGLALAGGQSAGTFAHWGTPTIKFHQARGAVSGLLAGLLAETGFAASEEILTGALGGLLNTYSDGGDPDRITQGLGESWDLESISMRLWPVASSIQSVVTAVLALVAAHDLRPEQIKKVTIGLSPVVYGLHGTAGWDRRFEAMISARYVAAVTLHDRRCWFDQFGSGRLDDPTLTTFAREQLSIEVDRSVEGVGAVITVGLNDGSQLVERRDYPRGDVADPLNRVEIVDKYRAAAGMSRIDPEIVERALDMMLSLEELSDVSDLASLLEDRGPGGTEDRLIIDNRQAGALVTATPDSGSWPTHRLAEFIAGTGYEDLPKATREYVKYILIDTVACALAADLGDEVGTFSQYSRMVGGNGSSVVIGSEAALSVLGATLLNAWRITAVSVCDIYAPARVHITPEVIPPLLAVAERDRVTGKDLVTALAVGLETAVRVAKGIGYDAAGPWHLPGIVGPFGAAAAVSRLRGLDVTATRNALGLAGSQSAGTWADWGTPAVKFHQVAGAVSGLVAALLAEQGFESSREVLTHPDGGVFNTYSDGGNPGAVVAGLASDWELEDITLRLWPGPVFLHPPIHALSGLLDQQRISIHGVEKLKVFVAPFVYERLSLFAEPQGTFEALLSVTFAMAMTLEGSSWLTALKGARHLDQAVIDFMHERVEVLADPRLTPDTARVELHEASGSVHTNTAVTPAGRASQLVTYADIEAKFRMCASDRIPEAAAERLLDLLANLDQVDDLGEVYRLLRAPALVNAQRGQSRIVS